MPTSTLCRTRSQKKVAMALEEVALLAAAEEQVDAISMHLPQGRQRQLASQQTS